MRDKTKLAFDTLLAIAAQSFCLAVLYAAMVTISRYVFGVELWTPF